MDNIAFQYNRLLIILITLSPICGYVTLKFANMDFFTVMQFFSFLGIILLLVFRSNSNPIKFPRYLLFYLLFVLYIYYSTFIQLDRDFKFKYIYLDRMIGAFNFLFIIENVPISKKQFQFMIAVSWKILIVAVLVIIIQQVYNPIFAVNPDFRRLKFIQETDKNERILMSIYSWIGALLTVGFSFVPILILIVEDLQKKKKKLFVWILMGIIFALLSKARWIMLNTLLVFAILIIPYRNKLYRFVKYLILLPIIFLFSFIVLDKVGVDVKGIVVERILESDKKNMSQKSAGTRLLAIEAFNRFFWDQPFFGRGSVKYGLGGTGKQDYKLHSFLRGRSSQMHVGYLSLLYMYGLVGGSLFLIALYLLLRRLYKNAKLTGIWAPFLGFLGVAIANLTLVMFSFYEMGLLVVLAADKYYQHNLNKN